MSEPKRSEASGRERGRQARGSNERSRSEPRAALILGGAGFLGSHLARRLLESGQPVVVLDSLIRTGAAEVLRQMRADYGEMLEVVVGDSLIRTGAAEVLRQMRADYGEMLEVVVGDLRDRTALRRAVGRAAGIYHLAGRTSASESLIDPLLDFEVNLRATVDLLEELRRADRPIPLVHASTSKVYGAMRKLQLLERETRYVPQSEWIAEHGIDEHWPLEVTSPYGCSRTAADQYVLEYARSFRLPAVVARIACVYGPELHGGEDQGWITRSMARAIEHLPITIDGDGKQVRDVLHVFDLAMALVRLMDGMEDLRGHVFNVGGGPARAVSLRELFELMSEVIGAPITVTYAGWRDSDPRYYVANTSKLEAMTGWEPTVELPDGLRQLHEWLQAARRYRAAPADLTSAGAVSG